MARRRLILPTSLRGPLRMTPDLPAVVHHASRPRLAGKIGLVLLWSGLCAGLYLIGNLPPRWSIPATTGGASTSSPLPSSSATAPLPALQPPTTTTAAHDGLKPVRDKSNLAVFGTGLEGAADVGGADLAGADPENAADLVAPDDQIPSTQRHSVE